MANPLARILKGITFPGGASMQWSTGGLDAAVASMEQAQNNSAVFMVIDAIASAFPEPPIQVVTEDADGEESEVVGHPLTRLLRKPNPALDEFSHSWVTQMYLQSSGNAFWLKGRNKQSGEVLQLWPVSSEYMEPKWPRDGSEWISHYEYKPNPNSSQKFELPPSEVVHFRIGVDSENPRMGRAPLWYVLAEIFGDEEATKFTAQLLKNWGIPPIVIEADGNPPQAEVTRIKEEFQARYSGRNRGNIGFLTNKMKATVIGSKASDLSLDFAHRLPEERISGVYGVPAIVAGLGAGLDRATYANFKEAREMFTERKMVNLWRMDAAQIENQLLPDFSDDESEHVRRDLKNVKAFQEDETGKWARAAGPATTGLITRAEFLREIGKSPAEDGSDDVYMVPLNLVEVPVGESVPVAAPGDGSAPKGLDQVRLAKARATGARRLHRALMLSIAKAAPGAEASMSAAFAKLADKVASRVKAQGADDIWPSDGDKIISDAATGIYLNQAQAAFDLVSTALTLEGSFNTNDPQVVKNLAQLATRVTNINETTLAKLQRVLAENVDTPRDELRARIRQTVEESYAGRSAAIARTELRTATNQTAAMRYEDAGVSMVDVVDGDIDDLCAERNGQRVSLAQFLEWEASEHPNGTISAIPVVE